MDRILIGVVMLLLGVVSGAIAMQIRGQAIPKFTEHEHGKHVYLAWENNSNIAFIHSPDCPCLGEQK